MIMFDDEYSCERDTYGWKLHQRLAVVGKDGGIKSRVVTSYYGTLEQVCAEVVDRTAGACADAAELRQRLADAGAGLFEAVVSRTGAVGP